MIWMARGPNAISWLTGLLWPWSAGCIAPFFFPASPSAFLTQSSSSSMMYMYNTKVFIIPVCRTHYNTGGIISRAKSGQWMPADPSIGIWSPFEASALGVSCGLASREDRSECSFVLFWESISEPSDRWGKQQLCSLSTDCISCGWSPFPDPTQHPCVAIHKPRPS